MSGPTIVRGRWVFPAADLPRIDDGAVVVSDGLVEAALPFAEARKRHPSAPVIGSDRAAVLPGFINAHHHGSAVTAIQQGMPEDSLEPWLFAWAGTRDRDRYLDTLLSGARLLSTGVTTTIDMWSDGGDPETFAKAIRDARRGYADAGIRVAFAPGIKTQSFLAWGAGEDRRFIDWLPEPLRDEARGLLPAAMIDPDDYFAVMAEIGRDTARDPRFQLWYQFPAPHWTSDAMMQRVAEAAAVADTGIQTHADESVAEKLHGPRAYGADTMVHLEHLGVLGPRLSIAHGVWLTDAEIDALARTGAAVSHNPGSNLRLFAGIAPLLRLRAAGITVGLGMDATALDDSEDFFAELRLALRLCRDPAHPERAPATADLFAMATTGGARLMRREGWLGRLAPGYAADLQIVDLRRVLSPWTAPEADPLQLVLHRAGRRSVDTVMVAGEVVWRDGRPTRFDLAAAGQAFAERMNATPLPRDARAAVARITPHLRAWYAGWAPPNPDPHVAYNARR